MESKQDGGSCATKHLQENELYKSCDDGWWSSIEILTGRDAGCQPAANKQFVSLANLCPWFVDDETWTKSRWTNPTTRFRPPFQA